MKVLFITETMPYPLDRGGYIRSSYIIRELARYHELTLLTQDISIRPEALAYYQGICSQVICLPKPAQSAFKKFLYLVDGLLGKRPYPLNKNFSSVFLKRIKEEIGNYDVLHCDHLDSAQYLPHLGNPIASVFDTHNVLSILMERLCKQETSPLKRFYIQTQIKKIKKYEADLCARFSLCLTCSEEDKKLLQDLSPQATVEVIPNGVDIDYYKITPKPQQAPTLLFIGRLDYLPNSQGLLNFYHSVWPLIRQELPDIRWQIVGRNPVSSLKELANDKAVELITQADDMRPYLAASTVAVVPLQIGGGTRLKILEAMAAGVPVVSTSIGAEGIAAKNRREIVIADTPAQMAQEIITLCRKAQQREEMIKQAQQFVTQYSWELIGKKLLTCYNNFSRRIPGKRE